MAVWQVGYDGLDKFEERTRTFLGCRLVNCAGYLTVGYVVCTVLYVLLSFLLSLLLTLLLTLPLSPSPFFSTPSALAVFCAIFVWPWHINCRTVKRLKRIAALPQQQLGNSLVHPLPLHFTALPPSTSPSPTLLDFLLVTRKFCTIYK